METKEELQETLDNSTSSESQEEPKELSSMSDPESIEKESPQERLVFHEKQDEHSTLFDSFQFLVNTAIGSGCLLLPYCYTSGIGLSLIISIFFGILTYYTFVFLAEAGHHSRQYEYRYIFEYTFGKNKVWMMDIMVFGVLFGGVSIYCHWNGTFIPLLIGTENDKGILGNRSFWTMMGAIVLAIPLVCLKSLKYLEKLTMLASVSILILIIHALYWFITDVTQHGFDPARKLEWFNLGQSAITSLGVNAMAYNCHMNYFPALKGLKNPTIKRAKALASTTIGACFLLYNAFGLITYIDLFDIGKQSSLELYDTRNVFTKIVLAAMIFKLAITIPVCIWNARCTVNSILFKDTEPTLLRWILIGSILTVAAAGFAAISDSIIVFFDIVGGVFSPLLVFLMPAWFYLKNVETASLSMKILAYTMVFFTVFVLVISIYQSVMEVIALVK